MANRKDKVTIPSAFNQTKSMSFVRGSKHPVTSEIQMKQPL